MMWVFQCIKYSKCWSILQEHFVERKPHKQLLNLENPNPSHFPPFFEKKMFTFWLKSCFKSQIPRWAGQPACPLVYKYKSACPCHHAILRKMAAEISKQEKYFKKMAGKWPKVGLSNTKTSNCFTWNVQSRVCTKIG